MPLCFLTSDDNDLQHFHLGVPTVEPTWSLFRVFLTLSESSPVLEPHFERFHVSCCSNIGVIELSHDPRPVSGLPFSHSLLVSVTWTLPCGFWLRKLLRTEVLLLFNGCLPHSVSEPQAYSVDVWVPSPGRGDPTRPVCVRGRVYRRFQWSSLWSAYASWVLLTVLSIPGSSEGS